MHRWDANDAKYNQKQRQNWMTEKLKTIKNGYIETMWYVTMDEDFFCIFLTHSMNGNTKEKSGVYQQMTQEKAYHLELPLHNLLLKRNDIK